jgi:hypothetical protein
MASFLDDFKTFGIVAMVIGALMAISGIISIVASFSWVDIASIIYGLLFVVLGYSVYTGGAKLNLGSIFSEGLNSKFGILVAFVGVIGLGNIIVGIFTAIGGAIGVGIVNIIVGLICLIFAYLMKDGKTSVSDKIIWIILAIIFVVLIIVSVFGIFGSFAFPNILGKIFGVITCIAEALLYIMLFMYLISPEVKGKLGM